MPCDVLSHFRPPLTLPPLRRRATRDHMRFRPSFVLALTLALIACGKQPAKPAAAEVSPPASADVDPDKSRIQGSDSAKVWMVIASDFECPYCRAFHADAYPQIIANYVATGKIRVAFLNYPGSMHAHAVVSAEAAMCAGAQNRFWQMHDALFHTQEQWAPMPNPQPVFDSLANSLLLRMPAWRECVATHKTRPLIDADQARARLSGVNGTP